mgnify:CR=1 FL=1
MQESRYDMKHTRFAKVLVAMFAGVLMVAALADARSRIRDRATAIREPSVHDSGQPNYGRLKSRLESFTDAVSRGDVVGMRTQADNAFKAIDDLNNLNVPDASRISRRSTSTARPISRTR